MSRYLFLNSWPAFKKWYSELGKLRIFWAKPIEEIKLIEETNKYWVSRIKWKIRRGHKNAVMLVFRNNPYADMLKKINASKQNYILVACGERYRDYVVEHLETVSAESMLYVWCTLDDFGKVKNVNMEIKRLTWWTSDTEGIFRIIHRESWGFYIPPREKEHIVILASLNSIPVGMAYLNNHNSNIDYGVHVRRRYWRRGIGSAILRECIAASRDMGFKHVSVVRVFRKVGGRADDERASSFYEANNPKFRFRILRA